MSEQADKLLVCVATPCGMSYKDEFDEDSLAKVKALLGEGFNWMYFFSVVREAFDSGDVTVQNATDASVEVVCNVGAGKEGESNMVFFNVSRVDVDVLPIIVAGLVDFYQFQVHSTSKEMQLEKMSGELTRLRIKAQQIEDETRVLKESSARKTQMDKRNTQRIEELRKKIADIEERVQCPNGHSTGAQGNNLIISGNAAGSKQIGRIRQPLGDRECKPYDLDLLRLIKSRWLRKDQVNTSTSFKQVIIPFAQTELMNRCSLFPNKEQELIWKALDKIDEWDYNVFEIQKAMSGDDFESLSDQPRGGSLFITMYALFIKYGFLSRFNIDEQIALNWISNIEAGYYGNPYHNSMHAADVLHITHYILSKGGMKERCQLSEVQVFAALFAAAIHDYGHPGVNNNFQVKTQSYKAILYNDRSVLENLHLSSVFELMKNPKFNILESFSEEERREIRETVIEMVLATDMGLHERYVTQFRRRLGEHASFTDRGDQRLALAITLKMADISNCGRPLDIYLKWSSKVSDEFYLQGDRERNLGFPCSPFMDRLEPALAKGQIAFMNYIIIPFFDLITSLVPNMRLAVECAEICKAYWMQLRHDGKENSLTARQ